MKGFPAESIPGHVGFTGLAIFYFEQGFQVAYGAFALAGLMVFAELFLIWCMRMLDE